MNKKQLSRSKIVSILTILCILLSTFFYTVNAEATNAVDQKNVKVGFFQSDGYHEMDDDGIMSGYGFDFLQMMLRYNDWEYEYVGYDKNWGDMLDMLDSGEIDMVTLADKTPERQAKYVYSDKPIGTSSTIMTIKAENTDIAAGDYSTYNGKTIGLVKGSSHNAGFESYAAQKGFTYKAVYYDDVAKLLSDLREEKNIEIAVTSNMRQASDEIILDEFDATEYYAIVKKGNEELLAGINDGISQLDVYSKDWRNTLFEKYYSNINSNAISLTAEEREYIRQLKASGETLKVAFNPELKPYSYLEDGKAKGIAVEIFKKIAEKLDIPYELLEAKDRNEYKKKLNSGEADIDLTAYSDFSIAQKYNLEETDSYMETALAMIHSGNVDLEDKNLTVATVKDPTEFYGYNNELIYKYKYKEYGSLEECVNAVKDGDADVTYCYVYMAEQAVANDYTNKLQYTILQNTSFGLAIGVVNQDDHRLLSVLNKGVGSLDKETTDKIILEESAIKANDGGIVAFAYSNPGVAILIAVTMLLIIFLLIILIFRSKNQREKLLSSYEFERFVSYVCESYDLIEEINLHARTKKVYQIRGEELEMKDEPFIPYNKEYLNDRVHPDDEEVMEAAFSEKAIEKMWDNHMKENFFDARVKDESGEYQWYAYVIKVIPIDENHPMNFMLFKKNMQKIKEQEEEQKQALKVALDNAQKANNAKGAFVSKVSHEIRTPLNAIIGYLNIAEEEPDDKFKMAHCIHNCKNASNHLLSLINDVLDLSAIENNKMQIANNEFDFKEMITEICNVYYNQANEKQVDFKVDIHSLTEETLVGDVLRTKEIIINLLSNSIKFTAEGGSVNLDISQIKQDEKLTHIRFIVRDTGIGMDAEYMEKIFAPFEQETATTAQKYGGSGLGLAITKNLVDLLNGSITVKSEKNVGTEFTVVLAFERCKQTAYEPTVSFGSIRVLIASANKESAEYMKGLLKRCKVKSDTTDTVEKTMKRIEGRKGTDYEYNICIVDDTEKDLDGRKLAKDIIASDPENHPDIIPVTYHASEIEEAAYAMGIRKIIEKPLFQSTMVDLLMDYYGKGSIKNKDTVVTDSLKGMHVLLAEDNEMNMEIAVHILTKAGVEVTKAVDGVEASEKFIDSAPGTYEAILMDIQMPRMDGYEATKKIRESNHEEAKSIPIIALTANAFSEDISKALSAGMNEHIAKPVDDKKLYNVLTHIFESREQDENNS